MSRIVQIQGETPIFPGNACVHCLQPAARNVEVVKVKENGVVRKMSVPFCDDCIALRQAKTSRQVQFERLGVGSSIVLACTIGVWAFSRVVQLERWMWGSLLGLLAALISFGIMYMLVLPWSWGFRSPETIAVLKAVCIRDFDWETTTLEFANDEYAERFAQSNRKE